MNFIVNSDQWKGIGSRAGLIMRSCHDDLHMTIEQRLKGAVQPEKDFNGLQNMYYLQVNALIQ